jgi:hypothetical protein
LFDQAAIWLRAAEMALRGAWRLTASGRATALSGDQLRGLLAILERLREEVAAVRLLAVAELPMPAMQIIRSISEDVDMALIVALRPKVARQFGEYRTPEADCLAFATLRLQELCVYSMMLGEALRADLALGEAAAQAGERALCRVALAGGEILLDQMRWPTTADELQPTVS